jgi:integrative and conjugative element protein (TIGR02256 family)
MPALLISDRISFEYPEKAWDLVTALEAAGSSVDDILTELANGMIINRVLRASQMLADAAAAGHPIGLETGDADSSIPLITGIILGTPARRINDVQLAHLAAWALGGVGRVLAEAYAEFRQEPDNAELLEKIGDITRDWLHEAKVTWMRVLENRPEVTRRRDEGTAATRSAGRRVLVLGCGALGGPVAEYCVRAGVAALDLVDNGIVTPGVLVRQSYSDADVGRSKAKVLAARLSAIRAGFTVEAWQGDAIDFLPPAGRDISSFDLIIDATADAGVRAAIELRRRSEHGPWPALATMVIGHDATRGLITISSPEATGGGASALRQVGLHALANPTEWADVADDFFPDTPRTDTFLPEPGCSAPTFVGGAAQTTALAGLLLNEALAEDRISIDPGRSSGAVTFASAVRIGDSAIGHGTTQVEWAADTVTVEDTFGYVVRLSPAAVTEMRTEVRRGARVRGPRIETGGILLGSIDDAAAVIYVDRVTGPPPDSYLSPIYFQHGQTGAQQSVDVHRRRSRGMSGFVGYWHTHPGGAAAPSRTDEEGMASIVTPDGSRQRAAMVILGGRPYAWDLWVAGQGQLPALFARLVPRGAQPTTADASAVRTTQQLPEGPFFRGGFDNPITTRMNPRKTMQAVRRRSSRNRWLPWRRSEPQ